MHPQGLIVANRMLLIQTFLAKAAHALHAILLVGFSAQSFVQAVVHILPLFVSLSCPSNILPPVLGDASVSTSDNLQQLCGP